MIYFVKAGESRLKTGLPWTMITLFAGWWGIPWGPIFSIQCLYNSLSGGQDVTAQVQDTVLRSAPTPPPFPRTPSGL